MAKMSAISFNLSMAHYPSQRRFESRERVSNSFSWPEKGDHILTTAVLSLSWEHIRRDPFVFRMPLLPRSVLPTYPSESPSELQTASLPVISLLLLNLFPLLHCSSFQPLLKEASEHNLL